MNELLDLSDEYGPMGIETEQSDMISRFSTLNRPNSKMIQLKSWFCKDKLVQTFKAKRQESRQNSKIKIILKPPPEQRASVALFMKNTVSQPISCENSSIYMPSTHRRIKASPIMQIPLKNMVLKEITKAREIMHNPMTFEKLITQLRAPFISNTKAQSYGSVSSGLTKDNLINKNVQIPQKFLTKTNSELRKEQVLLARRRLEEKRKQLREFYMRSSAEPSISQQMQCQPPNKQSPIFDRRTSAETSGYAENEGQVCKRKNTNRFRVMHNKSSSLNTN
jgi:hypothetical protein